MMNHMIDPDLLAEWGGTLKEVQKEEIIFQEGSHCCFYYQVLKGSVRWVNINDQGSEFIQGLIEPGESFGELPLFDDAPYAANAIANEKTVLIRLAKSSFLQLLREQPEIHFAFSRMLTERLRFKFMVLKELACHNPEHSISTLLQYFKENKKFVKGDSNQVMLTRQQIANMTGLRVETVIRAMRKLQADGKLTIQKGKVFS